MSSYKSFVADVAIFFDKNGYEESLSIDKLIVLAGLSEKEITVLKGKIEIIKRKNGVTIRFIQKLRNADVGHQEINSQPRHVEYENIENLFKAVQEILNLISNGYNQSIHWWDHVEKEINRQMKWITDNLERGEKYRLEEIENKYKQK